MDFIDSFVAFTDERPSPELFRKWSAITTLGGALEKRIWTKTKAGPQFANLYTMLIAPPGIGKCIRFGELVLTYDGRLVPVETLAEGDLLMGPDSTPRKVLASVPGYGQLYKVTPTKGRAWYCNADHILSLRKSRQPNAGTIKFVTVAEWLQWTAWQKSEWKLWRTGVENFAPTTTPAIDPYLVGLVLGDGDSDLSSGLTITTSDHEIVAYLQEQALEWNLHCVARTKIRYSLIGKTYHSNGLLTEFQKLFPTLTCATKFVPQDYRAGTKNTRLQILAGLLDSDGSLTPSGTFDFVSKSKQLAEDVAFLARSLGLLATLKSCVKSCGNFIGGYWRVLISGNVNIIPCKLPRKQAGPRKQIKDVLNIGFTIEKAQEGWWAGLSVDGDNQFLLDDFTVMHNSQAVNPAEALVKATKKFGIAPNSVTKASFIDALNNAKQIRLKPDKLGTIEYHHLFVFAAELGVFLSAHDLDFLSVINELFDHKASYREERRHSLKEPISIINPMTTMLIGSQPGFLATLLPDAAWTMGWTSRMLMVYSSIMPDVPLFGEYKDTTALEKKLTAKLTECADYFGEIKWDAKAIADMERWRKDKWGPVPDHPKLANYVPRRGTIFTVKLAMISAMSRGEELAIRLQDVERARGWLLEIEELMPQIFRDMIMKSDDQVIEETFQFVFSIYLKSRTPIPGATILRFLAQRTPADKAEKILELMQKAGILERQAGTENYIPRAREMHGVG